MRFKNDLPNANPSINYEINLTAAVVTKHPTIIFF